ncbi:MAG: hypothetical protein KC561_06275 [Myxococcales bacterium]|nr:hypothetical protein [Myxococcales bacterium]
MIRQPKRPIRVSDNLRKCFARAVAGTALLGVAVGCSTTPVSHRPVSELGFTGDDDTFILTGPFSDLGPCEIMEIVESPIEDLDTASIVIEDPDTLTAHVELQLDLGIDELGQDPWGSWLEVGPYYEIPPLGASVIGARNGQSDICNRERHARFEVTDWHGLWDIENEELFVDPADLYRFSEGLDPDDDDVQALFQAGYGALQGSPTTMTIEVEGTYGQAEEDEFLPAWRLTEPDLGFIEIEYSQPNLAPDEQELLEALLEDDEIDDFEELPEDEQAEYYEAVAQMARGSEFEYEGYLNGEVRFVREGGGLYVIPVFVVTAVITED